MIIRNVKVINFRNIARLDWEPHPKVNIIYGNNGQGKTSLVEAMWLFSGAKSFTHAKDKELIKSGEKFYCLSSKFVAGGQANSAQITYGERKQITINNVKHKNSAAFVGKFCCVVFAPNQLGLVKGGPEKRRNFVDLAISQVDRVYLKTLLEYSHLLKQRNCLLRQISVGRAAPDALMDWDIALAKAGAKITDRRLWYLQLISATASKIYEDIANGAEALEISYSNSKMLGKTQGELETNLFEALQASQKQDIRLGFTGCGVHRDDISIKLNGFLIKNHGSQGQQRSCVIALKLAECQILSTEKKLAPVIFLDDILSELDVSRRQNLLAHLGSSQIFITCCEKPSILFQGTRFYRMESGRIYPE